MEPGTVQPAPDEEFRDFLSALDADLSSPDRWPALSADQLCHVLGSAILTYAAFTLEEMIPKIIRMYRYVVEHVPAERRFTLMRNITARFADADKVPSDAHRRIVDALLPFITHDPAPTVVAAATLDYAVFRGSAENPWNGVYQAFQMFEKGDVANRPAVVHGLIALGDRRLSPKILELAATMGPDLAAEMARFRTGFVTAATVELCCEWLEALLTATPERDPRGSVFGHVGGALARLGIQACEAGVADISRSFPPTSPEDAVVWHNQWTRPQYARLIEPRLQDLARKEHEPRIMPDVMAEWGLQCVNVN
jgi:hypothetical protein